jgi:hypothetical protein
MQPSTPSQWPPTPPISQLTPQPGPSTSIPNPVPHDSPSFVITPRKTRDGISIDIKTPN